MKRVIPITVYYPNPNLFCWYEIDFISILLLSVCGAKIEYSNPRYCVNYHTLNKADAKLIGFKSPFFLRLGTTYYVRTA